MKSGCYPITLMGAVAGCKKKRMGRCACTAIGHPAGFEPAACNLEGCHSIHTELRMRICGFFGRYALAKATPRPPVRAL